MNDEYNGSHHLTPPVGWLALSTLLAGLRWMTAYAFLEDKQDRMN